MLIPHLSVIILSYAIDKDIYEMNCRCIDSLVASESWTVDELEILLIESNKQAKYVYPDNVRVLVPDEKFGFHHFFNIGMDSTFGEFIAFCNNDIVFQPHWWSAIKHVKELHPKFMCFSPLDRTYPMMTEEFARGKDYVIGWENKRHFAAWCFVWERKVFDVIGKFDEIFDFYSADDDELMTLRKYAIPNVLVSAAEVKHLSQVVTMKEGISKYKITDKLSFPLTQSEIDWGLSWLWDDVRFYVAYQRMKKKWGSEHMRQRLHRVFEKYPLLNTRIITQITYNKKIVNLLAKITKARI